jgi:hypothetical protein
MSTNVVYMDNNATTRVAPEVLEAMLPFFSDLYGNPSSMHSFGGQVGNVLKESREQIANLIGASPDEIIFTKLWHGKRFNGNFFRPAGISGKKTYCHDQGRAPGNQEPLRKYRQAYRTQT